MPDDVDATGRITLPEALVPAYVSRSRRLRARAGQILIAEGAASDDVFYIISGAVRVSVLSFGGSETIFRTMGKGELVGELAAIDGKERSASVVALADSELASLSAHDFRLFLSQIPEAGYWMARQLTHRVRDLSERLFEMATLPIIGRLAAELLRQPGEVNGDRLSIRQVPTHADLASRIGTNRETVTKELRALVQRGLVERGDHVLEMPSISAVQAFLHEVRR
jgi:CRP-like cAMP-binding protein